MPQRANGYQQSSGFTADATLYDSDTSTGYTRTLTGVSQVSEITALVDLGPSPAAVHTVRVAFAYNETPAIPVWEYASSLSGPWTSPSLSVGGPLSINSCVNTLADQSRNITGGDITARYWRVSLRNTDNASCGTSMVSCREVEVKNGSSTHINESPASILVTRDLAEAGYKPNIQARNTRDLAEAGYKPNIQARNTRDLAETGYKPLIQARATRDVIEVGYAQPDSQTISPAGMASKEAHGSGVVAVDTTITPVGQKSAEAHGTGFGISTPTTDQDISPHGIASIEYFGAPTPINTIRCRQLQWSGDIEVRVQYKQPATATPNGGTLPEVTTDLPYSGGVDEFGTNHAYQKVYEIMHWASAGSLLWQAFSAIGGGIGGGIYGFDVAPYLWKRTVYYRDHSHQQTPITQYAPGIGLTLRARYSVENGPLISQSVDLWFPGVNVDQTLSGNYSLSFQVCEEMSYGVGPGPGTEDFITGKLTQTMSLFESMKVGTTLVMSVTLNGQTASVSWPITSAQIPSYQPEWSVQAEGNLSAHAQISTKYQGVLFGPPDVSNIVSSDIGHKISRLWQGIGWANGVWFWGESNPNVQRYTNGTINMVKTLSIAGSVTRADLSISAAEWYDRSYYVYNPPFIINPDLQESIGCRQMPGPTFTTQCNWFGGLGANILGIPVIRAQPPRPYHLTGIVRRFLENWPTNSLTLRVLHGQTTDVFAAVGPTFDVSGVLYNWNSQAIPGGTFRSDGSSVFLTLAGMDAKEAYDGYLAMRGRVYDAFTLNRPNLTTVDPCTSIGSWTGQNGVTVALSGGHVQLTSSATASPKGILSTAPGKNFWSYRYARIRIRTVGSANQPFTVKVTTDTGDVKSWAKQTGADGSFVDVFVDLCGPETWAPVARFPEQPNFWHPVDYKPSRYPMPSLDSRIGGVSTVVAIELDLQTNKVYQISEIALCTKKVQDSGALSEDVVCFWRGAGIACNEGDIRFIDRFGTLILRPHVQPWLNSPNYYHSDPYHTSVFWWRDYDWVRPYLVGYTDGHNTLETEDLAYHSQQGVPYDWVWLSLQHFIDSINRVDAGVTRNLGYTATPKTVFADSTHNLSGWAVWAWAGGAIYRNGAWEFGYDLNVAGGVLDVPAQPVMDQVSFYPECGDAFYHLLGVNRGQYGGAIELRAAKILRGQAGGIVLDTSQQPAAGKVIKLQDFYGFTLGAVDGSGTSDALGKYRTGTPFGRMGIVLSWPQTGYQPQYIILSDIPVPNPPALPDTIYAKGQPQSRYRQKVNFGGAPPAPGRVVLLQGLLAGHLGVTKQRSQISGHTSGDLVKTFQPPSAFVDGAAGDHDAVFTPEQDLLVAVVTSSGGGGTCKVYRCPAQYSPDYDEAGVDEIASLSGLYPVWVETPEHILYLMLGGKPYRYERVTKELTDISTPGGDSGDVMLLPAAIDAVFTTAWWGDEMWIAKETATNIRLQMSMDRGRTWTDLGGGLNYRVPGPTSGLNIGRPRLVIYNGEAAIVYCDRTTSPPKLKVMRSYDHLETWTIVKDSMMADIVIADVPEQWVGAQFWSQKLAVAYFDGAGQLQRKESPDFITWS